MVGLASGILYLASPLVVAGHPAAAMPIVPVATTAPLAEAGSNASARPVVVAENRAITDLGEASALTEMVAREARRQIREHPDPEYGTATLSGFGDDPERADDLVARDDGAPEPDLRKAVVAEHEVRIAYLKQRMDALRSDGVTNQRLEALRIRLRKAEAARLLAIARITLGDRPSPDCAFDRNSTPCMADRVASRPNPADEVHAYPRTTEPPRRASSPSHAAVERTVALHPAAVRSAAHRLAHARAALATARALLDEHDDRAPHPVITIAGLWQWAGSATWSLPVSG